MHMHSPTHTRAHILQRLSPSLLPNASARSAVAAAIVSANVGASVAIELDHVMEAALPGRLAEGSSSDVKRMSMLPDVAVWIAGMAAPLNLPSSVPVADVPS
jgi:hypothetical protein